MAGGRNSRFPKPNSFLKVLDNGAFALARGALDGSEGIVVKEPSRVDNATNSKSGSPNHSGNEVDVHHDPDASGAASCKVEFPAVEKLLKVGQFADDFADDISAHESEVPGVGCGLRRGRSSCGVT